VTWARCNVVSGTPSPQFLVACLFRAARRSSLGMGTKSREVIGAGGGRACGERPAATEDHHPAKALFDRKEWPEGYVFPACEPCNKATKHYEHVMSVLVRLASEREDDPQRGRRLPQVR
jgi:hypothetical protein